MINARRKGATFERTIANALKTWPGLEDARRGKPQTAGAIEPDVWAPWPLWCECKHGEHFTVPNALAQASRDIAKSKTQAAPLVIARQTGGDIFFAIHLSDAIRFLGAEVAENVLHDASGAPIGPLTPTKTWRVFMKALRATKAEHVGWVEETGHLFGWLPTLERLWRTKNA